LFCHSLAPFLKIRNPVSFCLEQSANIAGAFSGVRDRHFRHAPDIRKGQRPASVLPDRRQSPPTQKLDRLFQNPGTQSAF
jgi:hypothetical protein